MVTTLALIGIVSIFKDIQPEPIIPYHPIIPINEVEPIIPEFIYVRIMDSLNVRVGPSIKYPLIYRPRFGSLVFRKGAVCKVRNERIKGKDERYWYQIIPVGDRRFLRYPERVISRWFIASGYTEKIELKETITVFDDTQFGDKKIKIDLSEQKLRAFERDRLVLETLVSTGKPWRDTPTGEFQTLYRMLISTYMQGAGFDLPCVPFILFFTWAGHAIHGAYWHDEFGTRRSHGCINVPPDGTDEWLFWWSGDLGETRIIIKE